MRVIYPDLPFLAHSHDSLWGWGNGSLSTRSVICWSTVFVLLAGSMLLLRKKGKRLGIFIASLVLMCLIDLAALPVFFQSPLYEKHPNSHPLRALREEDRLKNLKLFSTKNLNIKDIWDAGRAIRHWDYAKDPLPMESLPIGLISPRDPRIEIPAVYLEKIDATILGVYPYPPKTPHAAFFVTRISPKHSAP